MTRKPVDTSPETETRQIKRVAMHLLADLILIGAALSAWLADDLTLLIAVTITVLLWTPLVTWDLAQLARTVLELRRRDRARQENDQS